LETTAPVIDLSTRLPSRLLAAGVTFHASLSNHDRPENVSYKPFNMNGARYYSFARKNVRFFALDTTQMDAKQVAWIDAALQDAKEDWKVCYFHHLLSPVMTMSTSD
jgi:hypothetical protein